MTAAAKMANADLLQLIELLRAKKWTLGFAESCTGGLLSATLAAIPGVSDIYMGAVVSYSNAVKMKFLDVQESTLKSFGAVSAETALEMARGACKNLNVQCSVAITGIAGPTGGSSEKPVGTVFFAIKGPDFEVAKRENFAGSRVEIQRQSVNSSVKFMLKQILNANR